MNAYSINLHAQFLYSIDLRSAFQVELQPRTKSLGVFTLTMISISAIIALRNLPTLAKNGMSVVFILGLAAILFFIPVALTCAELASGWPKSGGLYTWVREAFGEKSGALAIWLEWIESVVWLPTVLSFIASSIAYVISPQLADNRYFMLVVMLTVLWSGTLLNFLSMKTSGWISTFGILAGSIIPGITIVGLGALWLASGQPSHIEFTVQALLPDFSSLRSLAYFTAVALGFAGIEVAAFYVQEVKNPQRTFPTATFISAAVIIAIYVLGALSIAVVIPKGELNLSAGMMQAMREFFSFLNIPWATPFFALFSVIGGLALLNTWLIGPSKGLWASAMNNDLPKFTQRTNRFGSPVAILSMQALIGTCLVSMNLFIPTINHFYWIFQTQAAQLILLMYLMIFFSVIKLRYSQPDVPRQFTIPGGKFGLWLVAGSGILFCIVAFLLGFLPPDEYQFIDAKTYACMLGGGIILFCAPPFLWQWWQHLKRI
jgi:amino acid transporter